MVISGSSLLRLSLLSLGLMLPALGALNAQTAPAAVKPPEPATEEPKAEAETQKKAEAEKQKRTMADIRNLGTALFSWLTDQVETEDEPQAGNGTAAPCNDAEATRQKTIDVQDYPLISREDLEKFLVPQYVRAIPETDAWGNPYEVRLNTGNLMGKAVMSIRSPGRKGYYAGDVYKIEGFDPSDFDQDIVWVDGFFVRWPLTQPREELPRSPAQSIPAPK